MISDREVISNFLSVRHTDFYKQLPGSPPALEILPGSRPASAAEPAQLFVCHMCIESNILGQT